MVVLLGVNMHIYLTDAYTEYFPTHQSEICIYRVVPCTSILKMYTLEVSLHIYLNDVYSGCLPAHLP